MIIEAIVNLVTVLIKMLASPFSILPDTPESLVNAMDYFFDMVFSHLDFLGFFVNISTLKMVSVVAIAIWTLDHAYHFLMWILHKLPLSID